MKKSVFCIVAVLLLSLCLVSCRNNGGENSTEGGSGAESTEKQSNENSVEQSSEQSSEQNSEQGSEDNTENGSEQPTDKNTEGVTTENMTEDGQQEPDDRIFVRSDTGTDLNLVIGYTVEKRDDGSYTVTADIGLESYSLNVTARQNNNYLRIGDETYYFSTDAIDYKGEGLTVFDFGSHSFTVPAGEQTVPLYAVWYFNGTYSEKPMTAIIAEAEITLE